MTTIDQTTEAERLAFIAADSTYGKGANAATVRHSARVFSRYWRGGSALELGPAEGLMTPWIDRGFERITLVDGSALFCERLAERYPSATVVHSLFEQFDPIDRYDAIILGHVLEHVEAPGELLSRARAWLAPGGALFAAVPNAWSIHRQAAVRMGLLTDVHQLNDSDRKHGHRRVYDPLAFRDEFTRAGYSILASGGYWLKPVSNAQIEATWTDEMLEAFMELGEQYPDIAGEIYVVAMNGQRHEP